MRMTRNRFSLWRVLFNMKVLLTRVDRGSFRFDLNLMYMTYFIFPFSHKFQSRPLVCKKTPNCPWLLGRYSRNLSLAFYLPLGRDYFCPFPCSPLLLEDSSLRVQSTPGRQLAHYCSVGQGHLSACVPVWVHLKIAFEHRFFKMTDL